MLLFRSVHFGAELHGTHNVYQPSYAPAAPAAATVTAATSEEPLYTVRAFRVHRDNREQSKAKQQATSQPTDRPTTTTTTN